MTLLLPIPKLRKEKQMPASTPGQRAKWRVERAIKSSRPIAREDLSLMEQEGIQTPQNLSQSEVMDRKITEPQSLPQSDHPDPIPLQVNLKQTSGTPLQDAKVRSLKDTVTGENFPQRKLSRNEKVHVEFWATEFGPICVLVLWFALADLDKASFYAPSPEECKTASVPLGRISARAAERANLPDWAGDAFMTAVDLKDLGFAAMAYLERIGVLVKLQNYYSGVAARSKVGHNNAGASNGNSQQVPGNGFLDIGKLGIGNQYRPI